MREEWKGLSSPRGMQSIVLCCVTGSAPHETAGSGPRSFSRDVKSVVAGVAGKWEDLAMAVLYVCEDMELLCLKERRSGVSDSALVSE